MNLKSCRLNWMFFLSLCGTTELWRRKVTLVDVAIYCYTNTVLTSAVIYPSWWAGFWQFVKFVTLHCINIGAREPNQDFWSLSILFCFIEDSKQRRGEKCHPVYWNVLNSASIHYLKLICLDFMCRATNQMFGSAHRLWLARLTFKFISWSVFWQRPINKFNCQQ